MFQWYLGAFIDVPTHSLDPFVVRVINQTPLEPTRY
jgi:hypothetical protein